MQATLRRYTKMCDVQNLINVTLNQKTLLDALLPQAQAALFMNQRSRAVKLKPLKTSDSESSSEESSNESSRFSAGGQFKGDLSLLLRGFRTNDRLSRKLLLGALPRMNKAERKISPKLRKVSSTSVVDL